MKDDKFLIFFFKFYSLFFFLFYFVSLCSILVFPDFVCLFFWTLMKKMVENMVDVWLGFKRR